MRHFLRLSVVVVVLSVPSGVSWAKSQPETVTGRLRHGGFERVYHVFAPPGLKKPAPLLLILHGGGGDGPGFRKIMRYRFDRLAEEEGFIAVYPDAVDEQWNDGRSGTYGRRRTEQVDDVAFLEALIGQLSREYPVDGKRVFLVGFSSGGMMSFRAACRLSDRIAAIAVVAAGMNAPTYESCRPSHPVSVLMLHGTEDPMIPYDGGTIRFGKESKGEVVSSSRSAAFWVRHNQCAPEPVVEKLPPVSRRDRTSVVREAYGKGRDGAEVVRYAIKEGGHTWPGGEQFAIKWVIGRTSSQVNACDVIWDFFKTRSR